MFSTSLKQKSSITYGRDGSQHSFSIDERRSFVDYINFVLRDDPDLRHILPIDKDTNQIFEVVRDGLILCKLVNAISPGTINTRNIIIKVKPNTYEIISNINYAIKGAKDIGCNLVNINAEDIISGKPHIILGLLWNIIKQGLLKRVSLEYHPELFHLLHENEDLSSFINADPEKVLLRWFNYHLQNANHPRVVSNFNQDISDGENYLVLLNEIAPRGYVTEEHLNESNPTKRAKYVCDIASKLGVLKFITPEDILYGNKNLNMAFTAYLFNNYPGLNKDETDIKAKELPNKITISDMETSLRHSEIESEIVDRKYKELLMEEQRLLEEKRNIQKIMEIEEQNRLKEEERIREEERRRIEEETKKVASEQSSSNPFNMNSAIHTTFNQPSNIYPTQAFIPSTNNVNSNTFQTPPPQQRIWDQSHMNIPMMMGGGYPQIIQHPVTSSYYPPPIPYTTYMPQSYTTTITTIPTPPPPPKRVVITTTTTIRRPV